MKRSMMKMLILMTLLMITGCSGIEWFPDNRQPNPFYFTTMNDVPLNSVVTSSATYIGGNLYSTSITVTNGEMSLDGGKTWIGGSATLPAGGANVQVRHTSAITAQTATITTVATTGVSSTFTSITKYNQPVKLSAVFNSTSSVYSVSFRATLPSSAYLKTNTDGALDQTAAFISGILPGTATLTSKYTAPTPSTAAFVDFVLFNNERSRTAKLTPFPGEIMTMNILYPAGATISTKALSFSNVTFKNWSGVTRPTGSITFANITSL